MEVGGQLEDIHSGGLPEVAQVSRSGRAASVARRLVSKFVTPVSSLTGTLIPVVSNLSGCCRVGIVRSSFRASTAPEAPLLSEIRAQRGPSGCGPSPAAPDVAQKGVPPPDRTSTQGFASVCLDR